MRIKYEMMLSLPLWNRPRQFIEHNKLWKVYIHKLTFTVFTVDYVVRERKKILRFIDYVVFLFHQIHTIYKYNFPIQQIFINYLQITLSKLSSHALTVSTIFSTDYVTIINLKLHFILLSQRKRYLPLDLLIFKGIQFE